MPQSTPPELVALVAATETQLLQGNFDGAAEVRHELGALLAKLRRRRAVPTVWRARILGSLLFLPRLELDDAAACLLVTRPNDLGEAKPLTSDMAGGSLCLAGLFNAERANLAFRRGELTGGMKFARAAIELLDSRGADTGGFPVALAKLLEHLSHAWWARLRWQGAEDREARCDARERLDDQISRVRAFRRMAFDAVGHGGADVVLALLLDLAAEFDASLGYTEKAARLAQAGVTLLREGKARDDPRLAHLLYVLGKIESRRGEEDNFLVAVELFRSAHALYGKEHPFRFRAKNQEAQCLVRTGRVDDAAALLAIARGDLDDASNVSSGERTYVTDSFSMTALWLNSRKARNHARDHGVEDIEAWKGCERDALAILDVQHVLPARLRADSLLQLGLARARLGKTDEAERALQDACDEAAKADLATIQIAAQFMLAEAQHATDNKSDKSANRSNAAVHSWIAAVSPVPT